MAPDFAACGELYKNATSQTPNPYAQWAYKGPIRGVLRVSDGPAFITLEGCLALCGTGFQKYDWTQASNTITTWILPVVGGLLLQAPFESNRSWRTFFALLRWLGSPMSSLAYVFWNIRVTGKCALMVDMASDYDEVALEDDSELSQMRDAFYILAVMNHYSIKSRMPEIAAEKLLRIALFSDSLKLSRDHDDIHTLPNLRKDLAIDLRRGRRRGIVPVFISILWFLCSLGISIETAFGNLGENATAHNLAMGLMLGWIPVFILGSIIDRNPMSADDVRLRLNQLLDKVRLALLDTKLRNTYIRETGRAPDDFHWTVALDNHDYFSESFFSDFAGQGRQPFHYGVAHPILAGIERAYVAECGRDWLRDTWRARMAMVVGPETLTGLRWFDWRELWQILSAVLVVVGTVMGSFTISYWTPTVGVGCRSGGFMIFIIISFASLSIEMFTWWLSPTQSREPPQWLRRATIADPLMNFGGRLERQLSRSNARSWQMSLRGRIQHWMRKWEDLQFRYKVEILVLKPLDFINTGWLVYIILAQTFGWYRSCKCMSSIWLNEGGYIDFESILSYKAHGIVLYWGSGTALSLFILSVAILFIIAEWCSQSHLSTMEYAAASRGLRRTRWWKLHTVWLRQAPNAIIESVVVLGWATVGYFSKRKRTRRGRRSLIWSANRKSHQRPPTIVVDGVTVPDVVDDEDADLISGGRVHKDEFSLRNLRSPLSRAKDAPSVASTELHFNSVHFNSDYEPSEASKSSETSAERRGS